MGRAACAVLGIALLSLAACSLAVGVDGLTGGSQAGWSGDGGGSGDEASDDGGCDCLPPVPGGWSVVALDPSSSDACPVGYANPTDAVVDPSLGPATCTCTCKLATPPSCAGGDVAEGYSGAATCADGGVNMLAANGGQCVASSFGSLAAYHDVQGPTPAGGSCTAETSMALPPAGTMGVTCAAQPGALTACAGGGTCGSSKTPSTPTGSASLVAPTTVCCR